MSVRCSVRRKDAMVCLVAVFAGGFYAGHLTSRPSKPPSAGTAASPPPSGNSYEERGPPSKQELGQAGWTLLHTMAANFPEQPTARQQSRMETFLHVLGDHYPCEVCASHFRRHAAANPIAARSRRELSLWMCAAHNEVNVRNGKEAYYCDLGVLDSRWKDCGCGTNHTSPSAPPATPRRRRKAAAMRAAGARTM